MNDHIADRFTAKTIVVRAPGPDRAPATAVRIS
jgi:hypothetical protein